MVKLSDIQTFPDINAKAFLVDIDGFSYTVIYGIHANGYFICVPRCGWGCEAAEPQNVSYNLEKLIEVRCPEEIALQIARAIYTLELEL